MAFKCTTRKNPYNLNLPEAHVVIGGFQELQKGTLAVAVAIFRSKDEYIRRVPALVHDRYVVEVSELDLAINLRTGIYEYLMQQPEFVNPVADMDDDFPVTPIE